MQLALHSARFLRLQQLTGQVRQRLRRRSATSPGGAQTHAARFPGMVWQSIGPFLPPCTRATDIDGMFGGKLEFLNSPRQVGWPPNWNLSGVPKLWQYNLHYHEFLWELPVSEAAVVVLDWIEHYPFGPNQVGWEPYPVSLRLINWCTYFCGSRSGETSVSDSQPAQGRSPLPAPLGTGEGEAVRRIWPSIYQQANFLERHLETHLLGNHLLENAVALSIAGSCFGGPDANRWFRRGLDILRGQLPEQMLSDGGHFERSPMYHSRVVWCLLTLLNTGNRELATPVRGTLVRALRALSLMCHPDGQIALLNDSAVGIYSSPRDLLQYGSQLLSSGSARLNSGSCSTRYPGPLPSEGERQNCPQPVGILAMRDNTSAARHEGGHSAFEYGCFSLSQTGYYGSRTSEGHYLVCDFAPIGPDYIPGHAHGDIFSFELSYQGQRVVVDSGVFDYEISDTRAYCRSTRAHNTVTIDEQDQCEFWAAFRVARRGRPHDVNWTPFAGGFRIRGWHDGYFRLRGKPKHARQLTWHDAGILLVRDEIDSRRGVKATSRIHLHPDCTVVSQNCNSAEVNTPAGPISVSFVGNGSLQVEDSFYCPEFGLRVPNKALAWTTCGSHLRFGYCLAPARRVADFDLEHGATVKDHHYQF